MEEQFPVQINLMGGDQSVIKPESPIDDENISLPTISTDPPAEITDVDPLAKEEHPIEVEDDTQQNTHSDNEQETQETNDSTILDEYASPIDEIEIPDTEIPTEHVQEPVNQTNEQINHHVKVYRKSSRFRRVVTQRYDPSSNQKISSSAFACPVCRQKFKKKASMIYHRARHSYLFPIHCDTCYQHFGNKADKMVHEMKCNRKKFECYLCAAVASSMGNLKGHMHKHTGEKPFECLKCKVRFSVKKSLVKHEKTKHR